jgi:hypothetical protein
VSRLIDREPDHETIYPVEVPGHVFPRRASQSGRATLYFSMEQLTQLRANVAKAILKANKRRMESR